MRLILMSEAPPPTSGMYHCKVEVYRFVHNDKYIMKDVLWWSSDGKWLTSESNHTVVAWVDESEPDQDVLWDELETILDKELLEEYGPHYMVSSATINDLKSSYTLIRK